uniref:AAA family ATPase n=2 Tax=Rivihabitans pingtungensis TaxID=1054498 RepID=UPI002FDAD418
MIHTVIIKNFKSLENVTFRLGKFNCLVGMNGAGKSTVLQALDLLAQLMHGNVDQWLKTRGWESKDLPCRTSHPHATLHSLLLG